MGRAPPAGGQERGGGSCWRRDRPKQQQQQQHRHARAGLTSERSVPLSKQTLHTRTCTGTRLAAARAAGGEETDEQTVCGLNAGKRLFFQAAKAAPARVNTAASLRGAPSALF